MNNTSTTVPQLCGTLILTFVQLKKMTTIFSETDDVRNGGFVKVYRGTLLTGKLVVVKRFERSLQGNLAFRTRIKLLSRVHHRNVASSVSGDLGLWKAKQHAFVSRGVRGTLPWIDRALEWEMQYRVKKVLGERSGTKVKKFNRRNFTWVLQY